MSKPKEFWVHKVSYGYDLGGWNKNFPTEKDPTLKVIEKEAYNEIKYALRDLINLVSDRYEKSDPSISKVLNELIKILKDG